MENFVYGDFSAGLFWRFTGNKMKHHAGISAFHLNMPSQSFYKEPIYYQIKHLYYGGKTKDYANKPILSFGPNDTSKMKRDIHNKVFHNVL